MTSTLSAASPVAANQAAQVSLVRLYVLRATYLLLVVGLGLMIVPQIVSHELTSRGVIAALLGGIWVLAFIGIKHPLEMLPLLMFEFAWKAIWIVAYALPQWSAGQLPPTFAEDSLNISLGVILMPVVIPWKYVWRQYVKKPGARWRAAA